MKQIYALLILAMVSISVYAQDVDSLNIRIQEIENSLRYERGEISLKDGLAKIKVPAGFKFLDAEQAEYVLSELWGNPKSGSTLGLVVPEQYGVLDDGNWVFSVEFSDIGYVKDDDANDIDYADLLKNMQKEALEANSQREVEGYPTYELIGWASQPFYDHDQKTLHWAKEIKFSNAEEDILNYNIRILGRKGVLVLNAIADMHSLPEVQTHIADVTASITFEKGNSYFDFDPKVDQVAAWSLGGLVAGKMLAKAGFFAMLLKFWKVIAIALGAAGSTIYKFIRGKKEDAPSDKIPA
jgi:uncharacterized membrane-anchored protein